MRRGSHTAHEAKLFKSIAQDAMEQAVRTAKVEMRRNVRKFEDVRDEASARIRHRPFVAVGTAFGAGLGVAFLMFAIDRAVARVRASACEIED